MPGIVALVGGDEFRAGCEGMDRLILSQARSENPSLLVIPTAAAHQNPSRAAANGVEYFNALGANASPLMVLEKGHSGDAELVAPVESADVIYFTGGDPSHLLDVLTGSMLLSKVEDALARGAIVAGSSAGAMVMGSWMRFREWREALGIVPGIAVLPHHEGRDPDDTAREMAESAPSGVTVVGVDGRTCCSGSAEAWPRGWRAHGAGEVTVYREKGWRRFSGGQELRLDP